MNGIPVNIEGVNTFVHLFSPKYDGSDIAWNWLCSRSNGKSAPFLKLNQEQADYALSAGYITTSEYRSMLRPIQPSSPCNLGCQNEYAPERPI